MSSPLVVRYVETPTEKEPVAAFVRTIYEPVYETTPPIADAYVAVEKGGVILACMGLEFPGQDGLFQIERTYGIDRSRLDVPLSADNAVQLGRWSSIDAEAGMVVVLATVVYGLRKGKVYAFVEHSDVVHRHCRRNLGIVFHDVSHCGVNLHALPPEHRELYAKGTMKPYIVELAQMQEAVSGRVRQWPVVGL